MAISAPGIVGPKALTGELRKLASSVHTVLNDGTQVTKEEALAELIWKQALGWKEDIEINGERRIIEHKPVGWAQQYLFERLEGKAAIAAPDEHNGIKAADKVRDLAKQRLNKLSMVKTGPPAPRKQP